MNEYRTNLRTEKVTITLQESACLKNISCKNSDQTKYRMGTTTHLLKNKNGVPVRQEPHFH